jgi:hypothetical protein
LENATHARIRFEHGAGQLIVRAGADPSLLLAGVFGEHAEMDVRRDGEQVDVHSGLADVTIHVPPGVAASIRGNVGLASLIVDKTRFHPIADGFESPDFATAPNRVQIRVDGGLETVRVM